MLKIHEQLAALREERGYTLRQLSERTGVDYANISRIERGDVSPSITTLERLLDGLDAKIEIIKR